MATPNTDITGLKALFPTYEDLQGYIKQMEAQGDTDSLAIAQQLKAITPEDLELTAAQKRAQDFLFKLRETGIEEKRINEVLGYLTSMATNFLLDEVIKDMDPNTKTAWEAYLNTGPNTLQQLFMLNYFCTVIKNQSLDDLYDKCLEKAITKMEGEYESGSTLADKLTTMDDLKAKQVERLMDNGEFDEAMFMLYNQDQLAK